MKLVDFYYNCGLTYLYEGKIYFFIYFSNNHDSNI
jgi:hypothetical protein